MSALAAVRAGYGLVQLTSASRPAGFVPGGRRGPPGRLVVQVAGARYLAQAVLAAPAPTAAVLALGVEVDLLHAASMIALALASRRHRRAGLTDAAVAACFAAAGARAALQAPRRPPPPRRCRNVVALRDRWADALGRRLVPPRYRGIG